MSEQTSNKLRIGVDVGGTKIEAALIDELGRVVRTARIPARHGEDAVIEDIAAVAGQVCDDDFSQVASIGIGTPGQVDFVSGHVDNIVNLEVTSLDMGPLVAQRTGVPTHVENDVNAAALGAATVLGGGTSLPGVVAFLNFGTGLAAGLVQDGVLLHGASGAAGEVGHIPVEPHRLKCPCGQYGCLETVCSGASVARLWPSADPAMPDLIRRAKKREAKAVDVLDMVVRAIGDTIQIVAQSMDPSVIILGGGMAKTGDPLVEVITAELRRRESQCRFLASLDLSSRLRLAPLDQPVGAIGAAVAA
ncbi:ROK family protein [Bifidobacterium imperatoris]|uniref:NagC family transcriptional regulator n=1 Tax=Bifidobacterium imperatoris TaxID=2020965 RepID=A0A2N5ITC6_9BIFI|nr:ROK family protein [Bifidobacterium imperatoris]PLS25215.1 NagC family transcriptional regulator [Bifidobacterium imperatoris]QSY57677.1 ROK family protein [Bifidobacterium imperatoris]